MKEEDDLERLLKCFNDKNQREFIRKKIPKYLKTSNEIFAYVSGFSGGISWSVDERIKKFSPNLRKDLNL